MWYGLDVFRQGKSRPWAAYQFRRRFWKRRLRGPAGQEARRRILAAYDIGAVGGDMRIVYCRGIVGFHSKKSKLRGPWRNGRSRGTV